MSLELWQTLIIDNDYEINANHYPWQIRRKGSEQLVTITDNPGGYQQVSLNRTTRGLHRVIATQFIHNDDPEHKTEVDHINKHRDDNRIENLRWCTRSTNQKNRTAYNGVQVNYVDELSEDAFEITKYGTHEFEDLWYDPQSDKFYFNTGAGYREITVGMNNGSAIVQARDVNNKQTSIRINKFKRLYNIL